MPDLKELKRRQRSFFRQIRRDMSQQEKLSRDFAITEAFASLDAYNECKTLLAYCSTPIEVDTRAIVEKAFADGKKVAFPLCTQDGGMDFYIINNTHELTPDLYGIPAPAADKSELVECFDGVLCVVPALAYDLNGFRLGYGKGYYDRFISRTAVKTVGLCYENCVVDKLPADVYDRCVDLLLTDKEYRKIK